MTLMNLKETSEYLNLHKMTLYRLANKGKIPGIKVGGSWRFPKEKIDELFNFMLEEK